jgi:drug/metabolite transporter (DMT)-like permease
MAREIGQAPDAARDASALAWAALAIAIFSFSPVTMRILVGEMDPLFAGMLRTVGAIVVTLPLALRFPLPKDGREWFLLLVSAGGNFILFPVLFCVGGVATSGSHAALILAASPVVTGLCGAVIGRHMPGGTWWLGCVIAFIGEAALVLMRDPAHGVAVTVAGDLLVLTACLGSGIGYVAGAMLAERTGAWAGTLWSINVASLVQLPFMVWLWPPGGWMLDAAGWAALLHLTFGATVIALLAWLWALARGGIARVAVLQFVQPILGLGLAVLLLHERPSPPLLVAAGFILVGVIIARRR